MTDPNRVSVLFVCMGNICRSPSAEGVFEKIAKDYGVSVHVDSAGTVAHHIGESPDPRSQSAAKNRGYDLSKIRSRKVKENDYALFDYVLAMDHDNLRYLKKHCPAEHSHKVSLFLDFAPGCETDEVPDPYYGSLNGFDRVLDLIEEAAKGLALHIRQNA
ncbi:low molecular weight protein-tyrosine-phosphatase [Pleionea sp. CnH1-48]|uniref:low molecular weight protein-tyrosine-phosphatase n=1 Tax=Pleionea sp. CnH1-48 TaxID=2954494 RepID=UPI00209739CB|nr:low molecular weight protein-tyrosine-phosphatase [Pleionea sp. CnH1-48]MCO7225857.1 low molecular weight phosphotyrosine protein phosphatase [Pleionea sp. CnH1-48]